MKSEQFDLVAIGDLATDTFINLSETESACRVDQETKELCLRFGEKIPYDEATIVAAAGNSGNAAVSAARLGLRAALVSNLGQDRAGETALAALQQEKVGTDLIKIHPDKKTNQHYVLWYESDRTILVKHEPYSYTLPDLGSPAWIYLSSLGENSLAFHHELADYLQAHPASQLAFQPGTFQIKFGHAELREIYARTEILFVNLGEAQKILGSDESDIKKLLTGLQALGPKMVVITDARRGAYFIDQIGKTVFMPSYPDPRPPLERTGAGDAFASTFVSALAIGKSAPEALRWAPINSMAVVQAVGSQAGLLTREQLEKYLAEAPSDYVAREI